MLLSDSGPAAKTAIHHLQQGINSPGLRSYFRRQGGGKVLLEWSGVWDQANRTFFCAMQQVPAHVPADVQEQRYQALFNNSPNLIFFEDSMGLVTDANQSLLDTFGINKLQVIRQTAATFLAPEMANLNSQYLCFALQGSEMRFDLKQEINGEMKYFDVIKHPIVTAGKVVYVQTVAKDITPIFRSYEVIQQQAWKLNTVFESITDALYLLDKNWNFTYINSEAQRLLNLDRAYHIGKNIWEVFPEEIHGKFYQEYYAAAQTDKSVHFEAYYSPGNMWVEVKAFPSSEGLSVYFSDITARVRAKQELEKLSLVASKTNNSVIIADKHYKIEWVNEGFTRLLGYSMEEALGKSPSDLLHNHQTDRMAFTALQEKLRHGEAISLETLNSNKSGEEVWLSVEINAVFDEAGEISRFVEVQTDITSLKESELELSKLAKDLFRQNNALQQFTYIVSHNLRLPVANAIGLTNLLTKLDKHSEVYDKAVANLKLSMGTLDTVLRDINTILTLQDSKVDLVQEEIDLNAVLQQALCALQGPLLESGGHLHNDLEPGLMLRGNKAYLYSIFYNLLSNAIKYRAEERVLKVLVRSLSHTAKGVLLSFEDNGSGFNMKQASNHVFKLYKRFHKDRKGKGIGLYLVKAHVEAMGGHIEVVSHTGIGTKFLIFLPQN
ncbi:PAS domain-containing sensor histidine kinase [Pontibacter sp. CAU 1760]